MAIVKPTTTMKKIMERCGPLITKHESLETFWKLTKTDSGNRKAEETDDK